jgi:hypothetical protein
VDCGPSAVDDYSLYPLFNHYPEKIKFEVQENELWTVIRQPWTIYSLYPLFNH